MQLVSKMAGRRRQILQLEGGIGRSDSGGEFVSARQCVCPWVLYIVSAKTRGGNRNSHSNRTRLYVRCSYMLSCSYMLVSRSHTTRPGREKSVWLFCCAYGVALFCCTVCTI